MLKSLIISAPFGNWMSREYATSTLGTFTLQNRGGPLYRLWRMALTLRYSRATQSWRNKLGLPNPGLDSLPLPPSRVVASSFNGDGQTMHSIHVPPSQYEDKIISIFGFGPQEWLELARKIALEYRSGWCELNLSCPNVAKAKSLINDVKPAISVLQSAGVQVIAKLPPVRWFDFANPLVDYGVSIFHCCNTIATPGGGWSGQVLKPYSLWCVSEMRAKWSNKVEIIGGGGIRNALDAAEFLQAGANRVSVASMLLNPLNWKELESIAVVKLVPNPSVLI